MARLVKSVIVTDDDLTIDGEPFPWLLFDDGVSISEPPQQPEFYRVLDLHLRVVVPVGEGWGDDLATIEDRRTPKPDPTN